ncbi:MAG: Tat proofreading chaperone DmsD [Slackia sp.]|nr:Tat proofreading chaperone DmsD [Slackia sp.]
MFDRYDDAAFFASTLAPFFLVDPDDEAMAPAFDAVAALDADTAAQSWPFVIPDEAAPCLRAMVAGCGDAELAWEYRRLFIGPNPMPAPPWGSVYTDRECVVFGQATLELRAWMRRNGIARQDDRKTPEDHTGSLLLLASWIARHKPAILGEFLELHVLTWSSHMLIQLEEAARQPFYEGLARLTRLSLEGLGDALGVHPETPRFYR